MQQSSIPFGIGKLNFKWFIINMSESQVIRQFVPSGIYNLLEVESNGNKKKQLNDFRLLNR